MQLAVAGKSRLPVMVWIHGGSNALGSGSQGSYSGEALAARGVVLVTINYRLGIFGFFSHPELTRESPHHSSGNYGLLDQLAALRWVKENIAAFGGDPENVTVFGESAGSIDIGTLLTSPLSQGLFRRAIMESGPPFGLGPQHTLREAETAGALIGEAAPGDQASALARLRALPAASVADLAGHVLQTKLKNFNLNAAVVDGWLLPVSPAEAFASGKIQPVDLIIGINGRELSAFRLAGQQAGKKSDGGGTDAVKKLAETAHPLYGAWTYAAIAMYIGQILVDHEAAIDQAGNDMMMACPSGAVAAPEAQRGGRAFVYLFNRSIPGPGEASLGAFHGLEIPFVFGTFKDRGWQWLNFSEDDHRLSETMESYWTNFARSGNPNGAGLPEWSAWAVSTEPYMEFDRQARPVPRKSFSPAFCNLSPARLQKQLLEK
jgi:para-nitrobenzyl esterase